MIKIIKKHKKLLTLVTGILTIVTLIGVTFAAFGDKGEILGSSFSVASTDIKFLEDITLGIEPANLVDELPGPEFLNIRPDWNEDYLLKISNSGTTSVQLSTNAYYETANDPMDLRQVLYVEVIEWTDTNSNGVFDAGEEGTNLGKKSIVKWKTEGFYLGDLEPGNVVGVILRFSTEGLTESKQGSTALFDFVFDSIEI